MTDYPPPGVDLDRPSSARVYDYYLGGTTNWAVDRRFADRVLAEFPMLRDIAVANRLFLHRVVRHLVRRGVTQFLDVGSGMPTMGHAHQVADDLAPGRARVVYADYEPVAVAHSKALLGEHGDPRRHAVVHADLRDPDGLWTAIERTGVVDLGQPVALLMIAVLHFRQPPANGIGADLGPGVVARFRELLPPLSYLAISHITDDGVPPGYDKKLVRLRERYDQGGSPVIWRPRREIEALFGEFDLVPPGVTWTPDWHPEETGAGSPEVRFARPNESAILAGVARKP
ncbi:SAM-dependent methyltransferase [Amycolatopsis lurida]